MKKLIIIALLSLIACEKPVKYEKPFIIFYKSNPKWIDNSHLYTYYEFFDKTGKTGEFYELQSKYSIGDTIK
jgi:hypothetical protein